MKILIVKIGAIGDVIMTLPMLNEIKKKYPSSKVTWICGKIVSEILLSIPIIDRVVVVDDLRLFRGNNFEKFSELMKLWRILALRRFDIVINAHSDIRYRLLNIVVLGGIYKTFTRKKSSRLLPVPARHYVHEYIRLFNDYDGPHKNEILLPAIKTNVASIKFPELKSGKKYIAVSPAGSGNLLSNGHLRNWPLKNYVQLCMNLIDEGHAVIITGVVSDNWIIDQFPISDQLVNLIGKLNLKQLISVYSRCSFLITHDSGPMHIASLANIPVIGMFGPTSPDNFRSLHPLSDSIQSSNYLSCRPCYDGKTYAQCSNNVCMQTISVQDVLLQSRRILAQ